MGERVYAVKVALDPTAAQQRVLASHAGASRFVFNRMLAEVKSTLDARAWETRLLGGPVTDPQGWSLAALRRTWNANKHLWAPWWEEVSKEAFNHGLQALSDALNNWADSRKGTRQGRLAGFPKFRSRNRAALSFSYTTGALSPQQRPHQRAVAPYRTGPHPRTPRPARQCDSSRQRACTQSDGVVAAGPLVVCVHRHRHRRPGRTRQALRRGWWRRWCQPSDCCHHPRRHPSAAHPTTSRSCRPTAQDGRAAAQGRTPTARLRTVADHDAAYPPATRPYHRCPQRRHPQGHHAPVDDGRHGCHRTSERGRDGRTQTRQRSARPWVQP